MVTVPAPTAASTALSSSSLKLSDGLKSVIADNLSLSSIGDEIRYGWSLPEVVSDEHIAEAKAAVPHLRAAFEPARDGLKMQWLTALGVLVAGAMGAAEAKMRVAAIAQALTHPTFCFTPATKIEAARRFKFFPSFSELAAYLDEVILPQKTRLERLVKLAAVEPAAVAARRRARAERDEEVRRYEADRARRWAEAAQAREQNPIAAPTPVSSFKPIAATSSERMRELNAMLGYDMPPDE